jgi:hypothetical protein
VTGAPSCVDFREIRTPGSAGSPLDPEEITILFETAGKAWKQALLLRFFRARICAFGLGFPPQNTKP